MSNAVFLKQFSLFFYCLSAAAVLLREAVVTSVQNAVTFIFVLVAASWRRCSRTLEVVWSWPEIGTSVAKCPDKAATRLLLIFLVEGQSRTRSLHLSGSWQLISRYCCANVSLRCFTGIIFVSNPLCLLVVRHDWPIEGRIGPRTTTTVLVLCFFLTSRF